MKIKKWSCLGLLCAELAGCGGGGGGGGGTLNPPPSTPQPVAVIERFAAGVNFVSPKHMGLANGQLFVADGLGAGRIAVVDSTSQALVPSSTINVTSPYGIGLLSSDIYYTAEDASSYDGIYKLGSLSSLVALSGSNQFGGFAFYSTTGLFVANGTSVLVFSSSNGFSTSTQTIALASPEALASDTNKALVYASLGNNTVVSINPATNTATVLTQTNPSKWGPFMLPQGIAVSGGYAYVVSQGSAQGDGGYLSKVNTTTGETEIIASDTVGNWGSLPVGFCRATGIAIDVGGQYAYVSNGNTCTNAAHQQNQDQIFKIKLP
jgi:hypothetical protein